VVPWQPTPTVHDPVIFPGLYSASGFDMMSILVGTVTGSRGLWRNVILTSVDPSRNSAESSDRHRRRRQQLCPGHV
jgi:hypothetical protein